MRSLLRPGNLFVLITYLLLSVVPLAPLLFAGQTVEAPLRILTLELLLWMAAWSIFKRPAWFHIFLLPAFLALPIELYLRSFYGQGLSTHHLGIISETSPKEASEFLGSKIWLLAVVILSVIGWWWYSWKAAWRSRDLDWRGRSRPVVFVLLACGAAVWWYGEHYGVQASASVVASVSASTAASDDSSDDDSASDDSSDDSIVASAVPSAAPVSAGAMPKLPSWAKIPFDDKQFGSTWPFGLVVRGIDFWTERKYLATLSEKSKQFVFGSHQVGPTVDMPQIVVMVIGESSRYDRWSLNGYTRDTNPLLKTERNLVSLSNMVTSVSATRLSVPVIVSRKPATQSLQAGFSEKSFLSAYKEAGFKTYWLSNQMSFGQFDTPISVFAKEADVIEFMNLGGFTDNSSFDQVLLDPLRRAIADPAQKKLIVLHSLGNHWNYSHRHPRDFDKWKPSLFGVENPAYTDLKLKPLLNNSYDNSILYTDWFLEQVIAALKQSKQLSAMMYVSDHGQTLYDGTCNLAFHGHNTQFEFHIPALVWYSDLYQETYPDKIALLQRNKNARLSTENIFHTLLDMSNIRYSTEQLDRSFLSKKLKRHKRYVDSYGWSDYDNSTFKGDCREVMDKGKPLAQEK
ncbi:MAG TPA: phosphoethanolamine transferase [Burkholderiaceae bacterium]|jgi:glucan phosphoethanolaminetransferase (alkaline phosphatase superfamily)